MFNSDANIRVASATKLTLRVTKTPEKANLSLMVRTLDNWKKDSVMVLALLFPCMGIYIRVGGKRRKSRVMGRKYGLRIVVASPEVSILESGKMTRWRGMVLGT